jgi:hypothetical protein
MLKQLVKIANRLDSLGLTKEADLADRVMYKLAQISEEDNAYMRSSATLAKEIMNFIVPSIQDLDSHWSRSIKTEDEEDLRIRLGTVGFNINKSTPSGIKVEYLGGDYAPHALNVTMSFDVFSKEAQEILINKKGMKRSITLHLTLEETSEAVGGGSVIDLSLRDILEGGTNHNVIREFWPAIEVFREQLYHEVTHVNRSGSSPDSGPKGTIQYLMTPGEFLAHAHQVAITYYNQHPKDKEITWEGLLSLRYPRESSKTKVLNYYNLSQPDRIQKYQPLFNLDELDLSKVSSKFLEAVNSYYHQIQATH